MRALRRKPMSTKKRGPVVDWRKKSQHGPDEAKIQVRPDIKEGPMGTWQKKRQCRLKQGGPVVSRGKKRQRGLKKRAR